MSLDARIRPVRLIATILALGFAMLQAGCLSPGGGAFMSMVSGSFLKDEGNLVDAEKAFLQAS